MIDTGLYRAFKGNEGTFFVRNHAIVFVPLGGNKAYRLQRLLESDGIMHFLIPEHPGVGLPPGRGSLALIGDTIVYNEDVYAYDPNSRIPEGQSISFYE